MRIAEEGSFTRAAELLHVTQPALSHQVRALERIVGGPLLERLSRSVRLTAMGRAMLPYARAVLADAERALRAARGEYGLERGELQVATLCSIAIGVLPPALMAWRRAHSQIHVRLFEYRHATALVAAMTAGKADLAIGPPPPGWDGPVRTLGTEEFIVVVPRDDPLAAAGADAVDLATLEQRRWVHYAAGTGLAEVLDQACDRAGFQPLISVRTEQIAAAAALAAVGLGPALVPRSMVPAHFDGHVLCPNPPITRTLTAYTRHTPDPLTSGFVEALERTLRPADD